MGEEKEKRREAVGEKERHGVGEALGEMRRRGERRWNGGEEEERGGCREGERGKRRLVGGEGV